MANRTKRQLKSLHESKVSDIWIAECDYRLLIFAMLSIFSSLFVRSYVRTISTSLSDARNRATHSRVSHFALVFMMIFTWWCLNRKVWVEWDIRWFVFSDFIFSSILFCKYKRSKCSMCEILLVYSFGSTAVRYCAYYLHRKIWILLKTFDSVKNYYKNRLLLE